MLDTCILNRAKKLDYIAVLHMRRDRNYEQVKRLFSEITENSWIHAIIASIACLSTNLLLSSSLSKRESWTLL